MTSKRKRKPFSHKLIHQPARAPVIIPPPFRGDIMVIILTHALTKHTFAVRTDLILMAERDTKNPLEYKVITAISSQQGNLTYPVLESPEEVAERIYNVHHGKKNDGNAKPSGLVCN